MKNAVTVILLFSFCLSAQAGQDYADDKLFNYNSTVAYDLEACGEFEKAEKLKRASVNMVQIGWLSRGKTGSIIESAYEIFTKKVNFQHQMQGGYSTPEGCRSAEQEFLRLLIMTKKQKLENLKKLKGDSDITLMRE